MIDKKTEQLMWQEIDGTIAPGDRESLERFMSEHPDSRQHYRELVQFSDLLGNVEEIDPGSALREKIEAAIDLDRYAAPVATAVARPSSKPFSFRPRWGYGFAMTAGLLIGIIGYHLVNYGLGGQSAIDPRKLVGTIIVNPIATESNGLRIDLDSIQGRVDFHLDGSNAIVKVEVTSAREIDIVLEYEGQSLQVAAEGFDTTDSDKALHRIVVEKNKVGMTHLGSGKYYAVFQRGIGAESPLTVRLTAGRQVLLEERVFPQ